MLYEEAEQNGIAHFPQALEHICFELGILNDVLQLVVEEFQDPCKEWASQAEVDTAPQPLWDVLTRQQDQAPTNQSMRPTLEGPGTKAQEATDCARIEQHAEHPTIPQSL